MDDFLNWMKDIVLQDKCDERCGIRRKPSRSVLNRLRMAKDKIAPIVNDILISAKSAGTVNQHRISAEQYQDVIFANQLLRDINCYYSLSSQFTGLRNNTFIVNNVTVDYNAVKLKSDKSLVIDGGIISELLELYQQLGAIIQRMVNESRTEERLKPCICTKKSISFPSKSDYRMEKQSPGKSKSVTIESSDDAPVNKGNADFSGSSTTDDCICCKCPSKANIAPAKAVQDEAPQPDDAQEYKEIETVASPTDRETLPDKNRQLPEIDRVEDNKLVEFQTNDDDDEHQAGSDGVCGMLSSDLTADESGVIYISIKCFSTDGEELTVDGDEQYVCPAVEGCDSNVHIKLDGRPVTVKVNQEKIDNEQVFCINAESDQEETIKIVIKKCPDCSSTLIASSTQIDDNVNKSPKIESKAAVNVYGDSHESVTLHGRRLGQTDSRQTLSSDEGSTGSTSATGKMSIIVDPKNLSKSLIQFEETRAISDGDEEVMKRISSDDAPGEQATLTLLDSPKNLERSVSKLAEPQPDRSVNKTDSKLAKSQSGRCMNKTDSKLAEPQPDRSVNKTYSKLAELQSDRSVNKTNSKLAEPQLDRSVNKTDSIAIKQKNKIVISLTRTKICSSMELDVSTAETKLRDREIEHPKPSVMVQLKNLGVDNLLRASRPAKCCRKALLDERQRTSLPYSVSLKSLPLSDDDVSIIKESINLSGKKSKKRNMDLERTKMAYYVSLAQPDFTSSINFPWVIPSYDIKYVNQHTCLPSNYANCDPETRFVLKKIKNPSCGDYKAGVKYHIKKTATSGDKINCKQSASDKCASDLKKSQRKTTKERKKYNQQVFLYVKLQQSMKILSDDVMWKNGIGNLKSIIKGLGAKINQSNSMYEFFKYYINLAKNDLDWDKKSSCLHKGDNISNAQDKLAIKELGFKTLRKYTQSQDKLKSKKSRKMCFVLNMDQNRPIGADTCINKNHSEPSVRCGTNYVVVHPKGKQKTVLEAVRHRSAKAKPTAVLELNLNKEKMSDDVVKLQSPRKNTESDSPSKGKTKTVLDSPTHGSAKGKFKTVLELNLNKETTSDGILKLQSPNKNIENDSPRTVDCTWAEPLSSACGTNCTEKAKTILDSPTKGSAKAKFKAVLELNLNKETTSDDILKLQSPSKNIGNDSPRTVDCTWAEPLSSARGTNCTDKAKTASLKADSPRKHVNLMGDNPSRDQSKSDRFYQVKVQKMSQEEVADYIKQCSDNKLASTTSHNRDDFCHEYQMENGQTLQLKIDNKTNNLQ